MSFDWSDYLDLALELSQQTRNSSCREADFRSSISRAYYAAYHKSRQYAIKIWGARFSKNAHAHTEVANAFGVHGQAAIKTALDRMRTYRRIADYGDEFRQRNRLLNVEATAQATIIEAKQVLSQVNIP